MGGGNVRRRYIRKSLPGTKKRAHLLENSAQIEWFCERMWNASMYAAWVMTMTLWHAINQSNYFGANKAQPTMTRTSFTVYWGWCVVWPPPILWFSWKINNFICDAGCRSIGHRAMLTFCIGWKSLGKSSIEWENILNSLQNALHKYYFVGAVMLQLRHNKCAHFNQFNRACITQALR